MLCQAFVFTHSDAKLIFIFLSNWFNLHDMRLNGPFDKESKCLNFNQS